MAKNVNRPAGGIGSKANAPKATAYYTGAAAKGITPGYASQRGEAVGNHTMQGPTNYRGEPMVTSMLAGGDRRLGNAVAASTVCSVGGSRTVMPLADRDPWTCEPRPTCAQGRAVPRLACWQGRSVMSDNVKLTSGKGSMSERINNRMKPSNDKGDHHVVTGSGSQRVSHSIHHGGSQPSPRPTGENE